MRSEWLLSCLLVLVVTAMVGLAWRRTPAGRKKNVLGVIFVILGMASVFTVTFGFGAIVGVHPPQSSQTQPQSR